MKGTALVLAGVLWAAAASAQPPGRGRTAGSPNAPITIEVFSDFQCPACKTLHDQTLRRLMRDYAATGKVYLIHREFPLAMHAHSREAASYACAAARLGKYDQVADVLFLTQEAWAASGKVDEIVSSVLTPAEAAKVRALAKEPGIAAEIDRDVELGKAAGITQTPTMIVKHRGTPYPISGAVNYDLLRRFLDDQLRK